MEQSNQLQSEWTRMNFKKPYQAGDFANCVWKKGQEWQKGKQEECGLKWRWWTWEGMGGSEPHHVLIVE